MCGLVLGVRDDEKGEYIIYFEIIRLVIHGMNADHDEKIMNL